MHLYCITRGIKKEVDDFIRQLQGKWLTYKHKKDDPNNYVQLAVRPIQMWEIVFPREHKDLVLTSVIGKNRAPTQHKRHNKWIWAIRKALGVDKIEPYDDRFKMTITKDFVEVVPIGIKDDYEVDGYEQL